MRPRARLPSLESGNGQALNDLASDIAPTFQGDTTALMGQRVFGQRKEQIAPAQRFPVQSIRLVEDGSFSFAARAVVGCIVVHLSTTTSDLASIRAWQEINTTGCGP